MKILVGLSGGADSAAAAALLLAEGHEVFAAFLRLFEGADESAAAYTAERLGVPLTAVDGTEAFARTVVADFVGEYLSGRTPNPCVNCNREIKAALLIGEARRLGCDGVATGHYARKAQRDGRWHVQTAADPRRDQSYFLWRLTQEQLAWLQFPLADIHKQDLKALAEPLVRPGTAESREICFVETDYISFLETHLDETSRKPGRFVSADGRVLGEHRGVFRYTVGQRRGLERGFGERMYVAAVDAASGNVVLGSRADCERDRWDMTALNFQAQVPGSGVVECFARLRYQAPLLAARVEYSEKEATLFLLDGKRAVAAPGQSAACYDASGAVLLGGILEK